MKINNLMSLVIHFFKRSSNLFKQVKNNEFKISVIYKDANEKFTEADFLLQKMFEIYMAKYFPQIRIVGEEDTSLNVVEDSEYYKIEDEKEIDFNLIKESDLPEGINEQKSEELCLYIDPIDGTEQFIKRNFEPVTSLIGITLNQSAFIGFIYFPSYKGLEENSLVFFNIPTKGIFSYNTNTGELKSTPVKKLEDDQWTFISSGSKTNPSMKSLFEKFPNVKTILSHGLGNKAFECILNDYFYLASGKGLGLWDVCAGHSMIKEIGGGLYYLDGSEVSYPNFTSSRYLGNICLMTSNSNRVPKFLNVFKESNIDL
jgi:3'(2'), 5'-bisphosphate nucleotidase